MTAKINVFLIVKILIMIQLAIFVFQFANMDIMRIKKLYSVKNAQHNIILDANLVMNIFAFHAKIHFLIQFKIFAFQSVKMDI